MHIRTEALLPFLVLALPTLGCGESAAPVDGGSVSDAGRDADVVVLVTEWPEYREIDPATVSALTDGRVIIDGRNVLDPVAWRAAGWTYRGLGRP